MFRTILLSASVAGLFAALALTLFQITWITPLILAAETYESAAATSNSHAKNGVEKHVHATPEIHDHTAAEHDHHASAWQPANGFERTVYTLISNTVMGAAYALILAGVYTLWQRPSGITQGLLFGLAGFAVFFAAPGLGLPPELPGTEAANLNLRQIWWIGTAASTAVAIALLFAQKNWLLRVLGTVILLLPHIVGAPHPVVAGSLAPVDLQNHFRLATAAGNAVFWLLLGAISAVAWRKFSDSQQATP